MDSYQQQLDYYSRYIVLTFVILNLLIVLALGIVFRRSSASSLLVWLAVGVPGSLLLNYLLYSIVYHRQGLRFLGGMSEEIAGNQK